MQEQYDNSFVELQDKEAELTALQARVEKAEGALAAANDAVANSEAAQEKLQALLLTNAAQIATLGDQLQVRQFPCCFLSVHEQSTQAEPCPGIVGRPRDRSFTRRERQSRRRRLRYAALIDNDLQSF